jgi:hypothetical protein
MKYAKDVDVSVVHDEIRDAVVSVKQYPHIPRRRRVARAELGKSTQILARS